MKLISQRIFFVCVLIMGPAAFAQNSLIRPTDTVHFDIREIVNFGAQVRTVAVSVELCGALKQDPGVKTAPRVFCKLLDQSSAIEIEGRAQDQKFAIKKFTDGVQSKRRTYAEISHMAIQIVEGIENSLNLGHKTELSQIDFRLAVKFLSVNGNVVEVLDTQFSALPTLDTEAPAAERGLLINRHEIFNADRLLKTRVLMVITRRGPKA